MLVFDFPVADTGFVGIVIIAHIFLIVFIVITLVDGLTWFWRALWVFVQMLL